MNYKTSTLFKITNNQGGHKKKKTLPDGTIIRYETPSVTSVPVRLESNDTLIFRQCVPHQGMVYESNNVRFFFYMDNACNKRHNDKFMGINVPEDQMVSEHKLNKIGVYVPSNKTYLKPEIKSKKRKKTTIPISDRRTRSMNNKQ